MKRIITLLFPMRCPICDRVRLNDDPMICPGCRGDLKQIGDHYCLQCGKQLDVSDRAYCEDCKSRQHFFDSARAVYLYADPIRGAIYRFKNNGRKAYGEVFAMEIVRELGSYIRSCRAQAFVPVPITSGRRRRRGYNQAQVLATELSKLVGLPVCEYGLKKLNDTSSQKNLGAGKRRSNLADAFVAEPTGLPQRVILVDDIYTTGATADACALVLKKAGVRAVFVICLCIGKQ